MGATSAPACPPCCGSWWRCCRRVGVAAPAARLRPRHILPASALRSCPALQQRPTRALPPLALLPALPLPCRRAVHAARGHDQPALHPGAPGRGGGHPAGRPSLLIPSRAGTCGWLGGWVGVVFVGRRACHAERLRVSHLSPELLGQWSTTAPPPLPAHPRRSSLAATRC